MYREAPDPPAREEVERRWVELIHGRATREQIHCWAAQWVEAEHDPTKDAMVTRALQSMHGFSMAYQPKTPNRIHHGPPGIYVHSLNHIAAELVRWRATCREYDADPTGFSQEAVRRALAAVEAERRRQAIRQANQARGSSQGPHVV